MSRKAALTLLGLSLLLLIGITIAFAFPLRPLFIRLVVNPLIESFLVLRWYVHRLSQLLLWIVFVIIGALFPLHMLTRGYFSKKREKKQKYIVIRSEGSELRQLAETISRTHHRPFARRRVASKLVPLCVRLIAQHEGLPLKEARERFESFQWCDNEAVKEFFTFRRQYYGFGKGRAFTARLHEVVSFLEEYHQGA